MRLSDRRRSAAEEELTARFGRALDFVQRQVAARAAEVATTIVAAGTSEEQDDNRKWGALPLATAAASVDPAAVYDPTWWRKGYSSHVRPGVNGLYDDTVTRASGELGVVFDPDDPRLLDALDELDGETAESWGAGLADFVAGQVRASTAAGDTVDGLVARLRGADESWFSTARAALLASVAVATTYNRATLAAGQSARAQGTSSTKEWVTVGDDRVRDTHQEMDGQTVDVGDDFLVAGAYPAAGPHDARLPVEESVNCRCWIELAGDGGNVADETTSVDDSDVTYETDGSEEDALVASPSLGGGGLAVLDRIKPSVRLATTVWPATLVRFYSDDQPRDDHGRWGEGSGSGDSSSGPSGGAQVAPPASRDAIDAAKAYLAGGDARALKDATGGNGIEYDRAVMTARNELAHDAAHDEFHPEMSRAEYERAVLDKTRADLEGPIVMRVSEETLGKVLGDGRFRTQYEVQGRTGGGTAGTIREQKDGVLFGQGSGTPSDQRIVYGSVSTGGLRSANDGVQWEPGPNGVGPTSLDSYGKVQVVLNDDVRDRASYSYGDSFDGRAQPAPINEPSLNALPAQDPYQRADKLVDPLSINVGSNEFRAWNYLEVQVPGVSTSDIKEVVFPANPAAGTADRLKEAGISWRVL